MKLTKYYINGTRAPQDDLRALAEMIEDGEAEIMERTPRLGYVFLEVEA